VKKRLRKVTLQAHICTWNLVNANQRCHPPSCDAHPVTIIKIMRCSFVHRVFLIAVTGPLDHILCCRDPSFFSKHSTFTQTNLQAALQMRSLTYPPVDLELMQRYLNHLTSVNLIPHPTTLQQKGEFASCFVPHFTFHSHEAWIER
jgi:hypothetical protein